MDYKDQEFDGITVDLDGNTFKDCTFKNVLFRYAGGDLEMENVGIDRFRFQFGGDLARGLFALYQLFGTEGLLQIIRGFTEPAEGGEIEIKLPDRPN